MEWSKRERCCSREYSPSISLFILNLFHRGIMVRLSSPPSLFFRFFPFGHALTCASVRSPSVPSTSSTGWLVLFFFVSAVAGFLLTLAAAAAAGLFMPMVTAGYSVWGALVLNLVENWYSQFITSYYLSLLFITSITVYYCLLPFITFLCCLLLHITFYYLLPQGFDKNSWHWTWDVGCPK